MSCNVWVGDRAFDLGNAIPVLDGMNDLNALACSDTTLQAPFALLFNLEDVIEADVPPEVLAAIVDAARRLKAAHWTTLGKDGRALVNRIITFVPPTKAGPALVHKEAHLDAYWERVRATILDPWEAEYAKHYVGLVRGLKRDAVAKAKAGHRHPVDLAAWRDTFKAGMGRTYRSAFLAARRQMMEDTLAPSLKAARRSPVAAEADVLATLTDRVDYMLNTITESLDDRITTLFEDSENEDVANEDIANVVEQFFGQYLKGGKIGSIARTETSATVNAGRAFELEARNVQRNVWVTAMDEKVRETHVIYGSAGPMPVGFNWARLVGERYTLRRPYDPLCVELGEIINCRCFLMPADSVEIDVAHKLLDRWLAA